MYEKIVKYLVGLLSSLKKLILTHHSSEAESDYKSVKNVIINYVDKHGVSEFIYLVIAAILLGASILLFIAFMSIVCL